MLARKLLPLVLFAALVPLVDARPQPPGKPPAAKGRKVAFLVGVGSFAHDLANLNGSPQKDVAELEKVLKAGGFEVVTLTDGAATRKDIEGRFAQVVNGGAGRAALRTGDVLLVALCTHGFTLEPGPGKPRAPFLAAHDSKPNDVKSMVSLNGLIDVPRGSGATVLYLIDACREIVDPNRGVGPKDVNLPNKSAVLFACSEWQLSNQSDKVGGHGLFTFAVLKTLRSGDRVSWDKLVGSVKDEFQTPEYAAILAGRVQEPVGAGGQLGVTELLAARPKPKDESGNPVVVKPQDMGTKPMPAGTGKKPGDMAPTPPGPVLKPAGQLVGLQQNLVGLAITPDGKTALTAEGPGTLQSWNLDSRQSGGQWKFKKGQPGVTYSAMNGPQGPVAVIGAKDGLRLDDMKSGNQIGATIPWRNQWVFASAGSPDGQLVAGSCSAFGEVAVFRFGNGMEVTRKAVGAKGFNAVAFSADNRYLLVGTGGDRNWRARDLGVMILDLQKNTVTPVTTNPALSGVVAVGFEPGGKNGLALDTDGRLVSFALETGEVAATHDLCKTGGHGPVASAQFSRTGQLIVGVVPQGATIWQLGEKPAVTLRHPLPNAHWNMRVAMSDDGKRALLGFERGLFVFEPQP